MTVSCAAKFNLHFQILPFVDFLKGLFPFFKMTHNPLIADVQSEYNLGSSTLKSESTISLISSKSYLTSTLSSFNSTVMKKITKIIL